jgi:PAS domain S-box-containing protein
VKPEAELLEESGEQLYEEAPCGYLSTRIDGTIIKVNRTFEQLTGRSRDELVERVRFQDLLSPGGRIYHETHFAPLLRMQGSVREIAVEIVRADGSLMPALINSVLRTDESCRPRVIRTTVFDATDRRRYEEELLRSSRREHEIAMELQRSLLAGELPEPDDVELAVEYSPAITGTAAGGDWYDAFWIEDGRRLGLVVGDVVGRGIAAAAAMGQLRSAVRALASTGLRPADLLSSLDEYSRRHDVGRMTTLICAELDPQQRVLRFACAGHPPALIQPPAGEPRFAWGGRSLPLNPYGEPVVRAEADCQLEPGSRVWLYTDGLIERRHSTHDELEQLRTAVAEHGDLPLAEAARGVARSVDAPGQGDDSCLLVAALGPREDATPSHVAGGLT